MLYNEYERKTHFSSIIKGIASYRKMKTHDNLLYRLQTWDGWPNGLVSTRKFNSISPKVILVQPGAHARTNENNTEINLRRLTLGGQTLKNLRSLTRKFKIHQSERKPSQVHASGGQTSLLRSPFLCDPATLVATLKTAA